MFRKMNYLGVAVGLSLVGAMVVGCVGETGKHQGEGCSSDSDCGGIGTVCQPVQGRSGDFCCPSPLVLPDGTFSSKETNCQPVK
jgi:hypothetical protein